MRMDAAVSLFGATKFGAVSVTPLPSSDFSRFVVSFSLSSSSVFTSVSGVGSTSGVSTTSGLSDSAGKDSFISTSDASVGSVLITASGMTCWGVGDLGLSVGWDSSVSIGVTTGSVSCCSGSASSGSCLTVRGVGLETVSVVVDVEVTASVVVAVEEVTASVIDVVIGAAVTAAVGSGTSSEKGQNIDDYFK